jgi:3-isopropylmalate/(R)-2-methylmalate dehydratase large subunit
MGKTIAEKLFSMKSGMDVNAGSICMAQVDFAMMHDVNAPFAIDAFAEIEDGRIFDTSKVAVVLDHFSPAPSYDAAQRHKNIENFSKQHGLKLYGPGEGICHQLLLENGHVGPGDLVAGTDSHTCSYGALNAFGLSVGATEMAVILASGVCWFRVPESVSIELVGALHDGVTSKDISLEFISKLTEAGGVYKSLEFHGAGLTSLTIDSRIVLCNMASEVGVKSAVMPCDKAVNDWRAERGMPVRTGIEADSDAVYSNSLTIDLSALKPKIALSPVIEDVVDVDEMAGAPVHQVVIGSCTNGRYEDFEQAAGYLRGRHIADSVRLILVPASRQILSKMVQEGLVQTFLDAGAMILPPGCGPCAGIHGGLMADGEVVLSTTNRNVQGRMGSKKADIHIVSPATAAISAVTGKITSPI